MICNELTKLIEDLKENHERIELLLSNKRVSDALPLQGQMIEKVCEVGYAHEPYQMTFRKMIAGKIGACYVSTFSDGFARCQMDDFKEKLVDSTGRELVVNVDYDDITSGFKEGFALLWNREKNKYFFINKDGKKCFDYFDSAESFSEGWAVVRLGNYSYFINDKGERLSEDEYNYASSFVGGLAHVAKDGLWSYIDKKGNNPFEKNERAEAYFVAANDFSEGLAAVREVDSESYEFIYKDGSPANLGFYHSPSRFSDGRAKVTTDPRLGYFFIDKKGKKIFEKDEEGRELSTGFKKASDFKEGLAFVGERYVKKNEKGNMRLHIGYRYVDTELRRITAYYDECELFSGGHAKVKKGDKSFFIDKKGNKVFEGLTPVGAGFNDEGVAWVRNEKGEYFHIDHKGKRIF